MVMVNAELTPPRFARSARAAAPPVEWLIRKGLTPYPEALAFMEARAAAIAAEAARECVLLVEHPPLYTAGTSAQPGELLDARFPVFAAGRGGRFTYHGPGQRVAYILLDLKARRPDVRAFVAALEAWIIGTLRCFDIEAIGAAGRVGVWVRRPDKGPGFEDKIAAIGIRLRKWVSFHGVSLNVAPDLAHFSGIVPCGIGEEKFGITSLADLGHGAGAARETMMEAVDIALRTQFETVFGKTA